ncbi:hypothetical protein ACF09J_21580 [Streptomyces sp. NPDC014889]|uniref:hypothetical protein n=1 Tax=Streptomyces sp. NPDC014889 TaxID=3364928 RepID=UPI0037023F3E
MTVPSSPCRPDEAIVEHADNIVVEGRAPCALVVVIADGTHCTLLTVPSSPCRPDDAIVEHADSIVVVVRAPCALRPPSRSLGALAPPDL